MELEIFGHLLENILLASKLNGGSFYLHKFNDTNLIAESAVAVLVPELADAHLRLHPMQERRIGMHIAEAASQIPLHLSVERIHAIRQGETHRRKHLPLTVAVLVRSLHQSPLLNNQY